MVFEWDGMPGHVAARAPPAVLCAIAI